MKGEQRSLASTLPTFAHVASGVLRLARNANEKTPRTAGPRG